MKNQHILSKMINISNNSRLTNEAFNEINKMSDEKIKIFFDWLKLAERETETKIHNAPVFKRCGGWF